MATKCTASATYFNLLKSPTPDENKNLEQQQSKSCLVQQCLTFAYQATSACCYLFGGIFFLVGSILFYPCFIDVEGPTFGAWLFEIGCIFFTIGTLQDVWELRESFARRHRYSLLFKTNHSQDTNSEEPYLGFRDSISALARSDVLTPETFEAKIHDFYRFVPLLNAFLYLTGSLIFVVGAIYFIPAYYVGNETLGCYMFIVGCTFFCAGCIWDVLRLARINADHRDKTMRLANITRAQTIVASSNFIGCVLFIFGCVYFLPQHLVDDAAIAFSVNLFVVGSVFFIISALTSLVVLHRNFLTDEDEERRI